MYHVVSGFLQDTEAAFPVGEKTQALRKNGHTSYAVHGQTFTGLSKGEQRVNDEIAAHVFVSWGEGTGRLRWKK